MAAASEIGTRLALAIDAGDRRRLVEEPESAIVDIYGVSVRFLDRLPGASDCGIAGFYDRTRELITVERSGSDRRTLFSALHELGHHVLRFDAEAVITIDRQRRRNPRSRTGEIIPDAFAAELVVPSDTSDAVFGGGAPTASHVAALFAHDDVFGSRHACCIRAAQRSRGNGVVVLLRGRRVEACAVFGTATAIAAGTEQFDALLDRALRNGTARSESVRLRHGTGSDSVEYAATAAATDDGYVYVVAGDAVDARPGRLPALRSADVVADRVCEMCGAPVFGWSECCRSTHCPDCACPASHPRRTRQCRTCWTMKSSNLFPDGGDTCADCF